MSEDVKESELDTHNPNKHIYKALAEFQQKVPIIHKGSQAHKYTYADLPKIFEVIKPLLSECGLSFIQPINGNSIETIVFHVESGESIYSHIEIPKSNNLQGQNEFQTLGSAITYLRRYSLSSLLGLVTDKDADGSGIINDGGSPQSAKQVAHTQQASSPQISNGGSPQSQAVEATPAQLQKIKNLMEITGIKEVQILTEYNVAKLANLSQDQAIKAIIRLEKRLK